MAPWQRNIKRESIISNYKKSRDSYEEFRIDSEKLRHKDESKIIEYLKSDNIEVFFKAYNMKNFFNKTLIEEYNLNAEILSSTNWFKSEFSKIIKIKFNFYNFQYMLKHIQAIVHNDF